MRPAIFIGASVSLGLLFALQEWVYSRAMGSHLGTPIFFESWGVHFFLWGTLCWLLWKLLRPQVQNAGVLSILAAFLPLSIVVSIFEEMVFLLLFPGLPIT